MAQVRNGVQVGPVTCGDTDWWIHWGDDPNIPESRPHISERGDIVRSYDVRSRGRQAGRYVSASRRRVEEVVTNNAGLIAGFTAAGVAAFSLFASRGWPL